MRLLLIFSAGRSCSLTLGCGVLLKWLRILWLVPFVSRAVNWFFNIFFGLFSWVQGNYRCFRVRWFLRFFTANCFSRRYKFKIFLKLLSLRAFPSISANKLVKFWISNPRICVIIDSSNDWENLNFCCLIALACTKVKNTVKPYVALFTSVYRLEALQTGPFLPWSQFCLTCIEFKMIFHL